MMETIPQQCPVCESRDLNLFSEYRRVPALIGVLYTDRESAIQCPKGDIRLAWCNTCGFITNQLFDSARVEYCREYDNNLFFSPYYQEYAHSTATRLVKQYALRNKSVIGIGCGKGDFLALLCEMGLGLAVGFDPSFDPDHSKKLFDGKDITIIRDYYSEKYRDYKADLISCRYVFEHIPSPRSFLGVLLRAIGETSDTVLHFEVPNSSYIIRNLSGWDFIYEHCSYFNRSSLERVFTDCGFFVRFLEETFYTQFLQIEAIPAGKKERMLFLRDDETEQLDAGVSQFEKKFSEKMAGWRKCLTDLKNAGRRTVLWGAGAKGISFLNMLQIQDEVDCAVDINPYKRSMYIPGTGHKILAPGDLVDHPPEVVIITNRIYLEEIRSQLECIGLSPEILLL